MKSRISERSRLIGWIALLILLFALGVGSLMPGIESIKQAAGIREILRNSTVITVKEPNNPFVCLRETKTTGQAHKEIQGITDKYLIGVNLCMKGEVASGMEALKSAGSHANADVQYAGAVSHDATQLGIAELLRLGLPDDKLAVILRKLSAQPGIDPYPILRELARTASDQPETWLAWLQGSSKLEEENNWQAALDWINEGMAMAPNKVRSSLYLREGRIYQFLVKPADYEAALSAYANAIEAGGWIYPEDEVSAYLVRGDIYRTLHDKYSPDMALGEFQKALDLQPNNYLALLGIGYVYMYDFKIQDQAEVYFRRAMEADRISPYAYFQLGEIYRERGDLVGAKEWYQKALEYAPNWQLISDRLKELEANGSG